MLDNVYSIIDANEYYLWLYNPRVFATGIINLIHLFGLLNAMSYYQLKNMTRPTLPIYNSTVQTSRIHSIVLLKFGHLLVFC